MSCQNFMLGKKMMIGCKGQILKTREYIRSLREITGIELTRAQLKHETSRESWKSNKSVTNIHIYTVASGIKI